MGRREFAPSALRRSMMVRKTDYHGDGARQTRGEGFRNVADRRLFLEALGEACGRTARPRFRLDGRFLQRAPIAGASW